MAQNGKGNLFLFFRLVSVKKNTGMPRDGGQNTLDTISNAVAVMATPVRGSVSPSSRETEIVALEYHNNTSSSYVDVADINKLSLIHI